MDLNMVGAVKADHPSQAAVYGYGDFQSPPTRYRMTDFNNLCSLVKSADRELHMSQYSYWLDSELANGKESGQFRPCFHCNN